MGRRAAIDEDDQRTPPDRDVSERRSAWCVLKCAHAKPQASRKPSLRLITLWTVTMMMSFLMASSAELYAVPSWRQEDGGSALPGAGFDRARRLRLAQRTRRTRRLELHEATSTTQLQGRGSRIVECGRSFLSLCRSSSVSRRVLRLGIATRAVRARSVAGTKPFRAPPYGGADTRTHAHKDVRCARCARHAYVLSFPPPASVAMRERERHARVANTVSTSARRHHRVLCLPLRAPAQSSRRRAA